MNQSLFMCLPINKINIKNEFFFVKKTLNKQFIRFLIIGTINTAFSYSIYAFFLFLGLHYAQANLIALIFGIFFSFKTQGALVFKNSENRLFFRFLLCWLFIYSCNIGIISELLKYGFDAYISGALAIPLITIFSYFLQKYIVFRPHKKANEKNNMLFKMNGKK